MLTSIFNEAHCRLRSPIYWADALRLRKPVSGVFTLQKGVRAINPSNNVGSSPNRMKIHRNVIDRDNERYKDKHYRAHWQPLWAIIGLVLCLLLIVFSGWAAVYDLRVKSKGVSETDSVVDLVSTYLGVSVTSFCGN